MSAGMNAINFLISTIFDLYIMLVAIRFLMQVTRADYHNPLSQFVVKVTSPLLNPLRRFIPGISGYDIAGLALCFILVFFKLSLYKFIGFSEIIGAHHFIPAAASWIQVILISIVAVAELFFNVFIYAIIIQAIMSWIPSNGYNPVSSILHSITSPILTPVRKWIPPVSGIDLSVIAAIIGLHFLRILVIQSFAAAVLTG